MSAHVDDLAELYALGALEPEEVARVDAHAATCAACRAALGVAEQTVLALDDAFVPQLEAPEALRERIARSARAVVPLESRAARSASPDRRLPWLSAAAAFILGIGISAGPLLVGRHAMHDALSRDDVALAQLVNSHFDHVQLVATAANAPAAKALYARDGSWVYVIVDSGSCGCRVVLTRGRARIDLGAPAGAPGAATTTLFAKDAGRPQRVELVSITGGESIAAATLAYP